MFTKKDLSGYSNPLPGITMKTITWGEKTLMTEFRLEKGSDLPVHFHPHEQTGYLVSGRLRLTIDGEAFDVEPGDCWCIPSNAEHGAAVIENSVAVEVFSPVREDYLP